MRNESAAQVETVRTESAAQVEAVIASFRELAQWLPGIVPELVQGETVEAVQASVVAACEAYNRVAEGVTASLTTVGQQPGAGVRSDGGVLTTCWARTLTSSGSGWSFMTVSDCGGR